jgi:hypothetical protein
VQWIGGILRDLQAFLWLRAFSALRHRPRPAWRPVNAKHWTGCLFIKKGETMNTINVRNAYLAITIAFCVLLSACGSSNAVPPTATPPPPTDTPVPPTSTATPEPTSTFTPTATPDPIPVIDRVELRYVTSAGTTIVYQDIYFHDGDGDVNKVTYEIKYITPGYSANIANGAVNVLPSKQKSGGMFTGQWTCGGTYDIELLVTIYDRAGNQSNSFAYMMNCR